MANFEQRIKAALARADAARTSGSGPSAPFDKVLDDFVATLTSAEPYVGAAIERRSDPMRQIRSFVTWPRYRKDERSVMLSFWWDGSGMQVVNERTKKPFTKPEQLANYLVNFLETSAFPATISEYEERCKEDVDGFLRVVDAGRPDPRDVLVTVPAAQQKALALAKLGSKITVRARNTTRLPSTAPYDPKSAYVLFESGGYGLEGLKHSRSGSSVHITGTAIELPKKTNGSKRSS